MVTPSDVFASPVGEQVKPAASVVFITPEMAKRWLEANTHNRRIREDDVRAYAQDMADGHWKLTGESIKFAKDGVLLDGQHRLAAIVRSGETVAMFVMRGIDAVAQKVMDTGRKRTASDALTLANEQNSSLLAATIRLALGVESGSARPGHYQATHSEIEGYLTRHPELRILVTDVKPFARKVDCPPAVVAYTYYYLSAIHAQDAYAFWHDAAEKVGLTVGDPVIALTNRFAEVRRNRERLDKTAMLSLIYRAWNARRSDRPLRTLRVNSPAGGIVPIPEPR